MVDLSRDIGRMEGRQDAADVRLERMEEKMDEQGQKIDQLLEFMATAKGGAGMLFKVGSVAAALGAMAAEVINWFHKP